MMCNGSLAGFLLALSSVVFAPGAEAETGI
jgi:hypothetical protein